VAPGHRALGQLIEVAQQTLASPLRNDPPVLRRLTDQLIGIWLEASPGSSAADLRAKVALLLSRERKYQTRPILDGPWIRAELFAPEAPPIVVYLPETVRHKLPLYRAFFVRLIAEALPRQDEDEPSASALRVAALARIVSGGAP
jgi:hypothetical protein